jgi:hypothetical protein
VAVGYLGKVRAEVSAVTGRGNRSQEYYQVLDVTCLHSQTGRLQENTLSHKSHGTYDAAKFRDGTIETCKGLYRKWANEWMHCDYDHKFPLHLRVILFI